MAGSALKLPGSVLASPFGKFQTYEGIRDSTIMLWDAGYAPLAAVPGDNTKLTNLLRDRCAAVSGLAVADCDFAIMNYTATGWIGSEVTGKGAIHVASTQAGASQTNFAPFALLASANFKTWLYNNTDAGADYAVMITNWYTETRQGTAVLGNRNALSWWAADNSNYHWTIRPGALGAGENVMDTAGQAAFVTGTPSVYSVASKGYAGSKATAASTTLPTWASIGANGPWASFNYNKAPSGILYRVQVDLVDLSDLTGTNNARATALLAQHNAMLARDFAVGGRFYGDTYTVAATLKP